MAKTKGARQFPAICIKHPFYTAYNKAGISNHRKISNCWADFIGIHTKEYLRWKRRKLMKALR